MARVMGRILPLAAGIAAIGSISIAQAELPVIEKASMVKKEIIPESIAKIATADTVTKAVSAPVTPVKPVKPNPYAASAKETTTKTITKSSEDRPFFPASTTSQPQWYLDLNGGVNLANNSDVLNSSSTQIKYDTGYSFSSALGYRPPVKRGFWSYTRFETEVSYRANDIDNDGISPASSTTGDSKTFGLMVNAYYDLKNATPITPYVGTGFGIAHTKLDASRLSVNSADDNLAAYQIMLGFNYTPKRSPFTELHLGYRYFDTLGEAEFDTISGTTIEIEQGSHAVEGGVRLYF